jgi:LmbE family N-acetylglucosaminyl deacetylase
VSDPELRSSFMARLGGDEVIPGDRIVAVVAHADDETIGLGAQLPRMPGIGIVHVTDGAPRNLVDARRKGFATAEEYAAARRRELEAAAALAGVPRTRLISLGVADQDAAFNLAPLARRIAELIEREGFEVVLTHAYEGGHPDHDATAFAANAAARLAGASERPLVVEMPFYRAGPEGLVNQMFLFEPDTPELALWLDRGERALKRRLYEAHASQQDVLARFPIGVERFRLAPERDFRALPNGGRLHYETQDWGLSGERWLALAAEARSALAEA